MRVHKPAAPWERGRQVAVFVADQTYQWIGMQKRGRRSMVEQHDAFGMPVFIKHEVYINSVHLHALAGQRRHDRREQRLALHRGLQQRARAAAARRSRGLAARLRR